MLSDEVQHCIGNTQKMWGLVWLSSGPMYALNTANGNCAETAQVVSSAESLSSEKKEYRYFTGE